MLADVVKVIGPQSLPRRSLPNEAGTVRVSRWGLDFGCEDFYCAFQGFSFLFRGKSFFLGLADTFVLFLFLSFGVASTKTGPGEWNAAHIEQRGESDQPNRIESQRNQLTKRDLAKNQQISDKFAKISKQKIARRKC